MKFLHEHFRVHPFHHSRHFYRLVTDTKGRLLYANPLFEKWSGKESAQLSTLSITDIIVKEDLQDCYTAINKCLDQPAGEVISFCLRQKGSSSKIQCELSLMQADNGMPEAIQWIGVEEKNERDERFYENMIADSLDGILLTDANGMINFAAPSITKILGYAPEELVNKSAFDFIHPDDRSIASNAFYDEVQGTPKLKFINARLRQKSGEWLWCMVRGHNLLSNSKVGAMLIYLCDDTSRRNAEASLIESEQRVTQLIYNLSMGVLLMNKNGEVLICNHPAFELLGVPEDRMLGQVIVDFDWKVSREDGSRFPPEEYPIATALRTGKPVRDAVMGVFRPDTGERVWLLVSADPVFDDKKNLLYVICSYTDITDQRRLSRQLIEQEVQKQKMLIQATIDGQEKERSEIGRELHDNISQHITTTRLYLEVAKEKAEGELLNLVIQAHKGLMDIVNEIRHLSQSLVPPSLSDIGLVASIQDLCEPLKNTHAFKIDFQYEQFDEALVPDNMKLMLYRIIQEQINNIIRHAQATSILIDLQTLEDRLVFSIADNGKGFDPKKVKRGHGFDNISNRAGLFGGKLSIDSEPGRGCFVQVTIPLK